MNKDHENDEKTIQKIKESLDFLDTSVDVKKPDVLQLFDLINTVEEKKKAAKNKQFIIFLMVAAAAICLETFLFSRSTAIFVIVQAAALSFVIPSAKYLKRKETGRCVSSVFK
jgi:hypothetical protein